jgi:hypothetical protein
MFDKHEAEQRAAQTPAQTGAQTGGMARPKIGREAW